MSDLPLHMPIEPSTMMSSIDMLEETSDNEMFSLTEPMLEEPEASDRMRTTIVRFVRFNKRKIFILLFSGIALSSFTGAMVSTHRHGSYHKPAPAADKGSSDDQQPFDDDIYSDTDDQFDDDEFSGHGHDHDHDHDNDHRRRDSSSEDDYLGFDDDFTPYEKTDQILGNDDTRVQELVSILEANNITVPHQEDVPQSRAVQWLASEDPAKLDFAATPILNLIERYAVVVLFFATNGPDWDLNDGFLQGTSICNWSTSRMTSSMNGVYCVMEQSSVSRVFLEHNNLGGSIPTEISLLTNLRAINLAGNAVVGNIPDGMAKLSKLRQLDLSFNRLTGTIPKGVMDLPLLKTVHLEGNDLEVDVGHTKLA